MPKQAQIDLDFAFYKYLRLFYIDKRGTIRNHYRDLSKKFLDFNNPENPNSFLRAPQYEALEMYIFLKEFLQNEPVHQIFDDWYKKKDRFANRLDVGLEGEQMDLFGTLNEDEYKSVFNKMKNNAQLYPNYIFALTMGTGKTILMATCIFYEFILANKFPKDKRYCHNALVFAPDKTVLEALKEIYTFDKSKVVPPEYVNLLNSHLQVHFLEDAGTTLNTFDNSMFNLIISNSQKIILKRKHKEQSSLDKMFSLDDFESGTVYDEFADLYEFDSPEDEAELTVNQRYIKLTRLQQLGIFVDEAHHSFGDQLAKDMGTKKANNSLRLTINQLASNLHRSGTRVVACYNFTGTPYIGKKVLPEVVYAYGLKDAINNKYLKKVDLHDYTNPKTMEFVRIAIRDFWEKYKDKRYEGMLPKMAFFASTIDELTEELQPAVEKILAELNIPLDRILVNVGDPKHTTNDEIREFNRLDTKKSEKQFILLVNKGREGWNCRSLFGVALYRKPKSKVFVLQATMRCMRAIGDIQETANVYLSKENLNILEDELEQNFRLSTEDLKGNNNGKQTYEVRVLPPAVKVNLKRIHKLHNLVEKNPPQGINLKIDSVDTSKYRLIHTVKRGLDSKDVFTKRTTVVEDLTEQREKRQFSSITLTAEIARYLNRSCLEIDKILKNTQEGMGGILNAVNEYNELLYDWVIPQLFKELFELEAYERKVEEKIELVKEPKEGYYSVTAKPELVLNVSDPEVNKYAAKSFHVDTYCFDSRPERILFMNLLKSDEVEKVYFTGMLTHGQSEFFIHYIDPDSHTVRRYFPDFLVQKKNGTWVIIEVKQDNKFDDPVVQAKKEYASQLAGASEMKYEMIRGTEAANGIYKPLLK
ncbi:TnsA endonuclease N-terminal domain-containing protein [Mesobacillus jeotgali]|uniref:TnsA endonuclease N-terminal domain-containing protein n=1 Tax=Mesobacillus jeotgali TaxID=129985 RepID=UPI000C853F83|nr:TnsA endonuclease N-terminal domain-containing protein [Mesobacillus jeotgali]